MTVGSLGSAPLPRWLINTLFSLWLSNLLGLNWTPPDHQGTGFGTYGKGAAGLAVIPKKTFAEEIRVLGFHPGCPEQVYRPLLRLSLFSDYDEVTTKVQWLKNSYKSF